MISPSRLSVIGFFLIVHICPIWAWKIQYAEQFYKLYHQHFYRYGEDSAENVWYLSMALRSPFANPLNALTPIEDETEWEKYRSLFTMHCYLKLTDEYLALAAKYDKFKAYFYNYPWKFVNLDSLRTAEDYYKLALESWNSALIHQKTTQEARFRWIHLEDLQYWEDESHRIEIGELDYEEIIGLHLERLERVRGEFEAMDYETY